MKEMTLTPAMKQYMQIKEENPDCVVMFRMGDFYELFYEDAKTASQVLGITLTSRGKGDSRAPLAGIPYHVMEQYVKKFVQQGYKLAIVEQLEDPKKAKGVVKRGLVRIITPGTIIEDSILSQSSNNYLCALYIEKGYGLSFCDISTGEFLTTSCDGELKLFSELEKFLPSEILVPVSQEDSEIVSSIKQRGFVVSCFADRFFWKAKAEKTILSHFQAETLEGFGLNGITVCTSGALLSYLQETQKKNLGYINRLQHYSVESFMILDSPTQRNLELLRNIRDNTSRGTVFEVINKTRTSMGARKLKNWLVRPLRNREQIVARHDACGEIIEDAILVEDLKDSLANISDIERILSRVTYGTANGRDLVSLRLTLEQVKPLKELLSSAKSEILVSIRDMDDLGDLQELIGKAIRDEPPAVVREGNIIREGYNGELDELRNTTRSGRAWISDFEEKERKRTGIKNLKVRYNKVFGYFIEVTKANLLNVPDDYVRKQTQVNAERFITDELKEKESLVLGAQDKINALEYDLFCEVLQEVIGRTDGLQDIARKIATLDCILSLGVCALQNQYVRPEMKEDKSLEITGGRHPVVETIEKGSFVSNDTCIGDAHIHIITGPNMAGKSTYLRQVALITLLAQIGSFVPASSAKIGIVDRIFSRVGAYDDLSMGQSTFMVEMSETANILNNATGKSLIIMDEVGRGTSTYDGLSLAWSIIEFIRDEIGANTLFATHYHHLNRLAAENELIENYNVLVEEHDEKVVFLHKIVKGGTDKSYGIHVANIAGMPLKVIERAKVIMDRIENQEQLTITLAPRSRDDEDLEFMEPEPRRRKMKRDTPPITQQTLFQWDQ